MENVLVPAVNVGPASKKLAHGDIAANWECDGMKIAKRWWFA